MKFFSKVKYTFQNFSTKTKWEIIAVAAILCLALAINIPTFVQDMKKYRSLKASIETDGWKISTPEQQDMDSALLSKAGVIIDNSAACSFIVVRHRYIVYEKYNDRYKKEDYNNVFSVTKSFISALTGIAIREHNIGGSEDKLEHYLPDYYKNIKDPRWKDINVKNLLTMTPGFCEDLSKWTGSKDWVKATLDLPLAFTPGEKFQYANSASHLLSVILTKATGKSTYEFADEFLFKPLDIKNLKWDTDPQGYYTGYANLFLCPRDMAKFGCMYLNKGIWNGKQVVPAEWVEESTKVQYDFNKEEEKGYENGYGYKWWINGETGYYMYSALGYGGQSINVIPKLDLVVVITSIPDQIMSIDDAKRLNLIKQFIIPSIKGSK